MKKGVEVTILGQKIVVQTTAEVAFVQEVAAYVNQKVEEATRGNRSGSNLIAALLACLNIAGEHLTLRREQEDKTKALKERVTRLLGSVSHDEEFFKVAL